jgi:hypothetical protein
MNPNDRNVAWWREPNTLLLPVDETMIGQMQNQNDSNNLANIIQEGYALGVADILWTVDRSQVRSL